MPKRGKRNDNPKQRRDCATDQTGDHHRAPSQYEIGLYSIAFTEMAIACDAVTCRSSTSGNEMKNTESDNTAKTAPVAQPTPINVQPAWV